MIERLKIRIPDLNETLAKELLQTAQDRILLRVEEVGQEFPKELESVCVEVVTAMYNKRQMQHEGVSSESVDVFSLSFVDDLLSQYQSELEQYKKLKQKEADSKREVLRFL